MSSAWASATQRRIRGKATELTGDREATRREEHSAINTSGVRRASPLPLPLDPACVWHKWWNLLGGALKKVQIQIPEFTQRVTLWWKPRRNRNLPIEAYDNSD